MGFANPGYMRKTVQLNGRIETPIEAESFTRYKGPAKIRGGIFLRGASYVIIEDLIFGGCPSDSIQIAYESHDVVVRHCDLSTGGDGLIDITRGATKVDLAWNRFHDHEKTILITGDNGNEGEVVWYPEVTLHHNFFDGSQYRNPRACHGFTHAYNNYLRAWGAHGMQSTEDNVLLSEANYFDGSDADVPQKAINLGTDKDFAQGYVISRGDKFVNAFGNVQPPGWLGPEVSYKYKVEVAGEAMRRRIVKRAGVRQ